MTELAFALLLGLLMPAGEVSGRSLESLGFKRLHDPHGGKDIEFSYSRTVDVAGGRRLFMQYVGRKTGEILVIYPSASNASAQPVSFIRELLGCGAPTSRPKECNGSSPMPSSVVAIGCGNSVIVFRDNEWTRRSAEITCSLGLGAEAP